MANALISAASCGSAFRIVCNQVMFEVLFNFHSGNVGTVSRMTTAAMIGRKVSIRDHALSGLPSNPDRIQRAHGMAADMTAIQNSSTTRLERDTVEPVPEMRNHATIPVKG